jgi:hypothetical protein
MAEKLLIGSPKEVAENLMIVDLIRHDLHGFVGQDVRVKQFCSVEEYETVWQLVSVIEGKLSNDIAPEVEDQLGWEVLQRSLPPGMCASHFSSKSILMPSREHDWCPEKTQRRDPSNTRRSGSGYLLGYLWVLVCQRLGRLVSYYPKLLQI